MSDAKLMLLSDAVESFVKFDEFEKESFFGS